MMDPAVKTATVLCVLLVGFCAATLLRADKPKPVPSEPTKPLHIRGHGEGTAAAVPRTPRRAFPTAPIAPMRRHKIVDGDSLPTLAQRYLGSANRASDIFAVNRDILPNPQLLPIGAELKIPPSP